jgi:ribose-phosphate pyrophosphokinase
MMVYSGSSTFELGQNIADILGVQLGLLELKEFSDGETYVRFLESVRGACVFVLQSTCFPVNDNLMELLIMIDALKRASAVEISAVVPYYGYSRQDKKAVAREPITAKLVADLLSVAGVKRLLTMDLHADQIQGYFDGPVDHLTAIPILASYFREKELKDAVVVSPDVGRVKVVKRFADRINAPLAIIHKRRPLHNVVKVMHLIGDVKGKRAILLDDMIDTAGTMVEAADELVKCGAKEVYACSTHPVLSGPAIQRLNDSAIKEVVVTDTIPLPPEKQIPKIKVLSISSLFAQAMLNVYENKTVSALFE